MVFSLKGKTAIVTGGGSGIGKAISTTFARQGAHVCILDFSTDNGNNTVSEIEKEGGSANFYQCDVSNQEQMETIFDEIAKNKTINILINNAGIAHVGNIENTNSEDLDRLFNVNIKGVYNGMKAAISHFKKHKSGVIVNMASIAASVGISDRFAYSMTKGAVLTMTYSVAKDYVNEGIRCNCISPARVHTPFVDGFIQNNYPDNQAEMFEKLSKTQPIGRMGKPEEIANLALYLCSDEASFITGSNFPIDGGFVTLNN
ncbi:SDR family NAD(P)-dependent oxidoreductase [Flavobacterium weaverense]|uniref:NAD(P)-dependent dehydrogenase (Short-subunit alcohol dehydrogenase family) n=1 Tax=Flavobacterium weaverense TaxID=271156 RepID=A0A3L9ZGG5_9FLAO|nr:SDR family oxidoreductase [Flavobacterium weaverense]RMA71646.1 NAD(P)-dependent dehydrogenase (short-subunit alcohol dehydrogenase family) [Flavobacterium weaverense]